MENAGKLIIVSIRNSKEELHSLWGIVINNMESCALLGKSSLWGKKNYKKKRLKYSLGAEKELVKISVKNVQCICFSWVVNLGHRKADEDTGCVYWDGDKKMVLFLEILQYFYNKQRR